MVRTHTVRTAIACASAAMILAVAGTPATAQRVTPEEAASRLSGTWKVNIELSPRFAPRPGGTGRVGGAGQPLFTVALATPGARSAFAFQRRGGGGGGAAAETSEADRAGMAAIRGLQQLADTFTVKATAGSVTFIDPRGERTYVVDNKTTTITVAGAALATKSRWDRNTLKQEFVYGESRVGHDWEPNNEGTRLNFKMLVSSMSSIGPGTEAKAVYDKLP